MTSQRHRLVIVGGSDAGIAAGMWAHQLDPSIEPLVVVADAHPNFSICGLPFYLSGETPDWRDLAHRSRSDMEAAGLRFLLDHTATQIDADRHALTVRDPDGNERAIGYDTLTVGTGAVPARPPIDGLDTPGVHVLHSMEHVFAVHDRISLPATRRAIIVGAGYIGLELADAFSHRGLDVTVIEMLDQVLATVGTELADPLRDTLAQHGVAVATGVTVHAIEPDGTGLRVVSDDGVDRTADVVVVAAGVRPNTALAQTAGAASATTARSSLTVACAPTSLTSTPPVTASRPGTRCSNSRRTCRWVRPRTTGAGRRRQRRRGRHAVRRIAGQSGRQDLRPCRRPHRPETTRSQRTGL